MDLGNPSAYGESQTDSPRLAAAGLIRAIESLEDVWQVRLGDADSSVAHFRHGVAIVPVQGDFDLSVRGRVFHGVINQDQEQPPQRAGVSLNPHGVAGN